MKTYDFTILNYKQPGETITLSIKANSEEEARKVANEVMQEDIKSNNYHIC